jgi:fumarylacetoacetase
VVTPEALAPFRTSQAPRPAGDPAPLSYLFDAADQATGAFDIDLEVFLLTMACGPDSFPRTGFLPAAHAISIGPSPSSVAHHTSGGCNLRPGDLFGNRHDLGAPRGRAGEPARDLREAAGNRSRWQSGESRRFLEDGDTVIMRAQCRREGFATIGFGECRGTVHARGLMRSPPRSLTTAYP